MLCVALGQTCRTGIGTRTAAKTSFESLPAPWALMSPLSAGNKKLELSIGAERDTFVVQERLSTLLSNSRWGLSG